MIVVYPLITLAAFGLQSALSRVSIPGRWLGLGEGRYQPGPAIWAVVLLGLAAFYGKASLEPINHANAGYREAARYLNEHSKPDEKGVDLTGLSLFYASRPGFTFEDLHAAPGDAATRWVIVREAHLRGEWPYCERIREIVKDRKPLATFPENPTRSQSKVFVFRLDRTDDTSLARGPVTTK
jgi:hypothetical protein